MWSALRICQNIIYYSCKSFTNVATITQPYIRTKHRSFLQCIINHRGYASRKKPINLNNEKIITYITEAVKDYDHISTKLTSAKNLSDKERQELNRQLVELGPLVETVKQYNKVELEMNEAEMMLANSNGDVELKSLLQEELQEYNEQKQSLELEILERLVPIERDHDYDLILEIQAGVGGQEAMLFAAELQDMYAAYSRYRGWNYDIIDIGRTELGGLRSVSVSLCGEGAYGSMKYECGVHRVQRIPQTEKTSRMHTSTATVAVMPQPDEIEVQISPKDLRMDTFRASGKGGQHINTTDSAVRVTHIPTGEVVECQKERSQIRNRQLALQILRSRLYERKLEEQRQNTSSTRKLQVGKRSRSEKIRTYNYSQDRVTDHRIGLTIHGIVDFMDGQEKLDEMIETLQEEARLERVQEIVDGR